MRDRHNIHENRPSEYEYMAPTITPPRGLFSRIIRRLGLEKELALVKENLKIFSILLLLFLTFSVFALIGLKEVLAESSFGPFVSLIFSDPSVVVKDWHSFFFSIFESMPGVNIVFVLVSLAFVLLFLRFAATNYERFTSLIKSIRKS